jgi:hypothetical protein
MSLLDRVGCLVRLGWFSLFLVCGPVSHAQPVDEAQSIAALERRDFLLAAAAGAGQGIDLKRSPKIAAYEVLAATAVLGCGPREWAQYMIDLPRLKVSDIANGPIDMFALPPLVRYLYQFGECLNSSQKAELIESFVAQNKRQQLTAHGTLNHAVMRATSWYLLAQYFEGAKWTDWNGKVFDSRDLMREIKSKLTRRHDHFLKYGHYELLSPTYAMVDYFPLLNLIDFAADPQVRRQAKSEALLELASLRAHSFHGVIVPPLTRKNFDQVNATDLRRNYIPSISQQILWYYYGEPRGLQMRDFRGGEPFYASMLALSKWRPPAAVAGISPGAGYRIRYNTPQFGIWDADTPVEIYGDSFINDDFAMGSGNLLFQPSGYSGHIQTFSILMKSDLPNNQIECYHPFWKSNLGEDAWSTDRSSPFQQMYRYDESSLVMLFDIPDKDPWPQSKDNRFWSDRDQHADELLKVAVCRVSRSFDEVIFDGKWVFIRQGDVYTAMAILDGKYAVDEAPPALLKEFYSIKVRQAKNAIFFHVAQRLSGLDFRIFQQRMKASSLPVFDASEGTVVVHEMNGAVTKITSRIEKLPGGSDWWSALPLVVRNGRQIKPDDSFVIDSPVLSVRDGVLRARSDQGVFELRN